MKAKKPEAIRRTIISGIMKALGMKKTHLTWSGERGKKSKPEAKEAHPQTEGTVSEGGGNVRLGENAE
jgi:hypothetical protein